MRNRGRAALQGRVTPVQSAWALAPVVVLPWQNAFFRKLFSRAVESSKIVRKQAAKRRNRKARGVSPGKAVWNARVPQGTPRPATTEPKKHMMNQVFAGDRRVAPAASGEKAENTERSPAGSAAAFWSRSWTGEWAALCPLALSFL